MSLRPSIRHWLLPSVAFVVVAVLAAWIASLLVDPVVHHYQLRVTDPRVLIGALAGGLAFVVTHRLVKGRALPTRGLLLSHRPIALQTTGYREASAITVDDVVAPLAALGYQLELGACDDAGQDRGPAPAAMPLAGANVRLRDRRLPGSVRLHFPAHQPTSANGSRHLGLVEIHGTASSAADDLGLRVVRRLDELLGGLLVSPTDSVLAPIAATLYVSGVTERPAFRSA